MFEIIWAKTSTNLKKHSFDHLQYAFAGKEAVFSHFHLYEER